MVIVLPVGWFARSKRTSKSSCTKTSTFPLSSLCTPHIREKSSRDVMYYITSRAPDAWFIAEAVRSHWEAENKVHWVLDVTYQEDHFRIRRGEGAENIGQPHR